MNSGLKNTDLVDFELLQNLMNMCSYRLPKIQSVLSMGLNLTAAFLYLVDWNKGRCKLEITP